MVHGFIQCLSKLSCPFLSSIHSLIDEAATLWTHHYQLISFTTEQQQEQPGEGHFSMWLPGQGSKQNLLIKTVSICTQRSDQGHSSMFYCIQLVKVKYLSTVTPEDKSKKPIRNTDFLTQMNDSTKQDLKVFYNFSWIGPILIYLHDRMPGFKLSLS